MADHVIDNRGTLLELKQNVEQLLMDEGYIQQAAYNQDEE